MRAYLTTANLQLRLVNLPAYSPDFNADDAIWDWAWEEVMVNTCFGTVAKVREKPDVFCAGLGERMAEVRQRCRTKLQALADTLLATNGLFAQVNHIDLTLGSV
jgi:hypothetical protein